MPVAPGEVRAYRGNGVTVFCVFFSETKLFADQMEAALVEMKKSLAGRVRLVVQQDSAVSKKCQRKIRNFLENSFRTVFKRDPVTVWLCSGRREKPAKKCAKDFNEPV